MAIHREWCVWDRQSLGVAAGDVDAWLLDTSRCPRISDAEFECLSKWETARAERFIFANEASRYLNGQLHLRTVLSRYAGGDPLKIRLRNSPSGQFFVRASPEIKVVTNHSGRYVLYVVTRHRQAGAGMQRVNAAEEGSLIAENFFSPSECRTLKQMAAIPQAKAFSQCWSRRSALLQVLQNYPLASLELPDLLAEAPFSAVVPSKSGAATWTLTDLPQIQDSVASLAVEGELTRLSTWLVLDHDAETGCGSVTIDPQQATVSTTLFRRF